MQNTRKALLLSALVLPGLGQIVIKRYKTGLTIIAATLFSLYRFMRIVFDEANAVVNQMMLQGGAVDISRINDSVSQAAAAHSDYNLYLWLIFLCWMYSLLDVWHASRKI